MLKNKKIFALVILTLYTVCCIAVIAIVPNITSNLNIPSAIPLLVFVLLCNIGLAFAVKETPALKTNWNIQKIYFFPIGFLFWGLVLGVSFIIKFYFGSFSYTESLVKVSVKTLAITLVIVTWEELMFRGIILNYIQRFASDQFTAVSMGLLFTLAHLLNPEFNILVQGLNLLLAGYLLTILYLKYKNIWLPLGFHFANNIFSSVLIPLFGYQEIESNSLVENEGYLDSIFLFIVILLVNLHNLKSDKNITDSFH